MRQPRRNNTTGESMLPIGNGPHLSGQPRANFNGFHRDQSGYLMCEGLRVVDIQATVATSPFYLMSKSQLESNFKDYEEAIADLDSAFIGYAVKANNNMNVLIHLANLGSGAVLVSGNEIRIAMKAGFPTHKMVFNGNGKTQADLDLAVENHILVNVDSEFDLEHIIRAGQNTGKKARALLRINPDVDPKVHPYVSTGLANSKFGIENTRI
jgi:diaminopimelate decarboxylase